MTENAALVLSREATTDCTIVHCSGRVIVSTAELLKAEVKPLLARGGSVVLDLSDVVFMDSMGLGTIAGLWVSSKTAQCQLRVVNLSPRLRDLFTITHLLSLFEACGEADAQIP